MQAAATSESEPISLEFAGMVAGGEQKCSLDRSEYEERWSYHVKRFNVNE